MAIYRQKESNCWWIDITIGGRRIRQSTGTDDKRKAKEYHDRLKAKSWEQERLGSKPRHKWRDAVIRFIREAEVENKASLENDRHALRWLDPYLGCKYLDEIDKATIDVIVTERLKPYTMVYKKTGQRRECKPGVDTVNRFLTTFRAVLNKARDEWEWIDRVPKIKTLKGAKNRVRWISRAEADNLLSYLPKHLAAMCEFSLQTGLRRTNVTHLEWSQIDLVRKTAWILSEQTKNGKALAVPLSDKAMEILKEWRGKHLRWVFPKADKPVKQTSTKAWRDALIKADIDNFCWHDLRHTWASWHVQNGTPLHVLQELGGWSSIKMVQRYAHLSSEHLRAWVEYPQLRFMTNNGETIENSRHSKRKNRRKGGLI